MSAVLGFGWLGYTAHLLPWGVTGNYAAALNFLLAIFLFSLLTSNRTMRPWQRTLALSLPIVLATITLTWIARDIYERNVTARGITDCAVTMGNSNVFVSPRFGPEALARIDDKLQIASRDDTWTVTGFGLDDEGLGGNTYIITSEELEASQFLLDATCTLPRAIVGTSDQEHR